MTQQPPEGYQPTPGYDTSPTSGPAYPNQPDESYSNQPAESAPIPKADHREDQRRKALDDVKHTRTRAAWVGLIVGVLFTLILLVFIVQNLDKQKIELFFWTAELPLGVSLLVAAILGALITAIIGGLRMLQVRRAVKKSRL
jgi:uncharacterized integral membrane protein